jgi:DNA-binding FadR family transcriptional regulator
VETLTSRTIRAIKSKISDGTLHKGDKLPKIDAMASEFGVSRTVVREAIAVLRSEGLVETKHGAGVFITGLGSASSEQQESLLSPLGKLETSFMDILELRMAFEVHAAGLAAARHSWAQEEAIWKACREFQERLDDEASLDQLDYEFHKSIAEATNNSAFIEFFNLMSRRLMPQPAFSRDLNPSLINGSYIQHTIVEHRNICEAISLGDADKAREAMRAHLIRSHRRYRGFADNAASPLSNVAPPEENETR